MAKKVYAYKKIGHNEFGVLEAIDYDDARSHLGHNVKIQTREIDLSLFFEIIYKSFSERKLYNMAVYHGAKSLHDADSYVSRYRKNFKLHVI